MIRHEDRAPVALLPFLDRYRESLGGAIATMIRGGDHYRGRSDREETSRRRLSIGLHRSVLWIVRADIK